MQLKRFFYLAGMILLAFLGALAFIFLVMVILRFLMGAMDQIPWMLYAYMSVMLMLPVVLFNTVFLIFFKRSATHSKKWVKWFSRIVFVCASIIWLGIFIWDFRYFIQTGYGDINRYAAYSLTTLVPTVFFIFFMGILQALTLQPELDWMERRRLKEEESKSL